MSLGRKGIDTDRIVGQRFRGEETVPLFLVRTDAGEFYRFGDEDIDQLIEQNTNSQLELEDLGETSETVKQDVSDMSEIKDLDNLINEIEQTIDIEPNVILIAQMGPRVVTVIRPLPSEMVTENPENRTPYGRCWVPLRTSGDAESILPATKGLRRWTQTS